MVVHHNDIGLCSDPPHLEDEAIVIVRAFLAGAGLGRGEDLAKRGEPFREIRELASISGGGLPGPLVELAIEGRLVPAIEGGALVELFLAEKAKIVLAALQEGESRVDPERAHERDV